MRLIPAIDLKGGRCVRLLQGEFERETLYPITAPELVAEYRALGADWLHVVDLDGARGQGADNRALIAALAKAGGIHLQVGGGIRDAARALALLQGGVGRIVVGSLAVSEPGEVIRWLQQYGPDRVVLALDVRIDAAAPRLATHGWQRQTEVSLWDTIERFVDFGLMHVLCTDISRDGALAGPNLNLYSEAVERFAHLEWQASGGIRDAADLHALANAGVAAAISGRALLEHRFSRKELRPFLPAA